MTAIEKIKAEIKRLKATNPSEYNYQNAEGYVWALDDILSFLSTLESEKPMNQDELEKELDRYLHGEFQQTAGGNFNNYIQVARHFYELGCRRTAEKYDEIEYNRQRATAAEEEETTRKEFVEELDKYFFGCTSSITMPECYKACEHFAEWGAERQKEQDDRMVDIIYQQGIEKGKDDMKEQAVSGTLAYEPHLRRIIVNLDDIPDGAWNGGGTPVEVIIFKKEQVTKEN